MMIMTRRGGLKKWTGLDINFYLCVPSQGGSVWKLRLDRYTEALWRHFSLCGEKKWKVAITFKPLGPAGGPSWIRESLTETKGGEWTGREREIKEKASVKRSHMVQKMMTSEMRRLSWVDNATFPLHQQYRTCAKHNSRSHLFPSGTMGTPSLNHSTWASSSSTSMANTTWSSSTHSLLFSSLVNLCGNSEEAMSHKHLLINISFLLTHLRWRGRSWSRSPPPCRTPRSCKCTCPSPPEWPPWSPGTAPRPHSWWGSAGRSSWSPCRPCTTWPWRRGYPSCTWAWSSASSCRASSCPASSRSRTRGRRLQRGMMCSVIEMHRHSLGIYSRSTSRYALQVRSLHSLTTQEYLCWTKESRKFLNWCPDLSLMRGPSSPSSICGLGVLDSDGEDVLVHMEGVLGTLVALLAIIRREPVQIITLQMT